MTLITVFTYAKVVEQKLVSHMESDERDFGYLKETMARIEASQPKSHFPSISTP